MTRGFTGVACNHHSPYREGVPVPTLAEVATVKSEQPDISDPREDYGSAAHYVLLHMQNAATDNIWVGKMGNVVELLWPTLPNDEIRNVSNRILKRLKDNGSIEMLRKGGPASGFNSQWRINVTEQSQNGKPKLSSATKKRPALSYSKTQIMVTGKCGHSWSTSARKGSFVICAQCNAQGIRVIVQVP